MLPVLVFIEDSIETVEEAALVHDWLYAPASDFVEEWDAKNYVTGTLPATKSPSNNGTLSGVARLWQYV